MCHEHKRLSAYAQPIADVLKAVNNLSDNNLWTQDEISEVSDNIVTDFFGNARNILDIGIGRPAGRKSAKPIILTYNVKNYKADFHGDKHTTKLYGNDKVDLFSFVSDIVKPNDNEGIPQLLNELIHIESKDKYDTENSLKASGLYADNTSNAISTVDFAIYSVHSGSGIFEGATTLRIDFNNVDKTRVVTVSFD
jgi:hypothetical protein